MNAVAGMLGNMEVESTINPGIWFDCNEAAAVAYGIVQWDPPSKYFTWCNARALPYHEMDSNLKRIIWEFANGEQYYSTAEFPVSASQFKTSTESAGYLAKTFVRNYERNYDVLYGTEAEKQACYNARAALGEKWYTFLSGLDMGGSGGGGGSPVSKRRGLPLWLLVSATRRRV